MRPFLLLRPIYILCTFFVLIGSCKKTDTVSNPGDSNSKPAVTAIGTPIGNLVTKNIGAAGGFISSEDGRVQLTIPAGALSANTDISIQAVTNQCPGGIGVAYDFLPNGTKFATPALLRFNYTDSDVNGTDPYLLYVAFHDSANEWELIDSDKDIDTIGKTASFDISHFTEMSMTPYIQITADKIIYRSGESGTLTIDKWTPFGDPPGEGLGIITAASPVPSKKLSQWTLSGIGSIKGNGASATYTAPGDIPPDQTVQVSVVVQDAKTVRLRKGKIITFTNKTYSITLTLLPSIIKFNIRLDLKLVGASDIFDDVYTDGATIQIQTNENGIEVKTLSIVNEAPKVNPSSGTNGTTSAEWVPDDNGVMNIATVTGVFYIVPVGDSISLEFKHIGAKTPKYSYTNIITGNYFAGGTPLGGAPSNLIFGNYSDHVQTIKIDDLWDITATVTPIK